MRNWIWIICLLFIFLVDIAGAAPIPAPPQFDVKSYILLDHNSGTILAEHNADTAVDPASITKLMTAYVVYQALANGDITLDEEVLISEKAWRAIGSRMFIEVNTRVSVNDLLQGMIVQSGNDASIALAERVGGTEEVFVQMMNAEAQRLGLNGSHFMNVSGLTHEDHYMTARDIATLSSAIIRDFPEQYKRYSQKKFTYNGIEQYNRNKLLWQDPSVDGLKTGHTDAARYCLAASAQKEDMRLVSVILGAQTVKARTAHSRALLNYGFRFYESRRLYAAGEELTQKRVWYGETEQARLGVGEDIYVLIPRGRYQDLQAFMDVEKRIEAPLALHQAVGQVRIMLDGEDYMTSPLLALEPVAEGSIIRKISDYVMGYFE